MAYTVVWLTAMAAVLAASGSAGPGARPVAGPVVGAGEGPGPGTRAGAWLGPGLGPALGLGVNARTAGARSRAGCTGPPGPAARCWPVTGPGPGGRPLVLRGFEPPPSPWAAGHRGVDLTAAAPAPVRAAAAGEVAFAGPVAGVPVVVVALPGGLRTTYEPVRAAVAVGARVAAGDEVGVAAAGGLPHCPGACLHWGLLRGDAYLDPLTLLSPALRRAGPSRLLPLYGAAGADRVAGADRDRGRR